MNLTRFLFGATVFCAVALCVGTTANAGTEQYSSKEVAPAPVVEPFSWTGFYIGGNLGGNWSNYRFGNFFEDVSVSQQANEFFGRPVSATNSAGPVTNGAVSSFGFASFLFPGSGPEGSLFDAGSDDAFTGGGQLGFNYQFGQHFLIGLEGDFNRTSTSRSQTFLGTDTTFLIRPHQVLWARNSPSLMSPRSDGRSRIGTHQRARVWVGSTAMCFFM